MTNRIACKTSHSSHESVSYDWEVFDAKGRRVGARVYRFMASTVEITPELGAMHSICNREDIGTWFVFRTDALRDGKPFGPGSSWYAHRYQTEADRSAAIEKFLKASKARALKQFSARV